MNWNSKLEHLEEDGFNSNSINVSVSVGSDEAGNEIDKQDTVQIGDYCFSADDIIKLAATVEHITNNY